jgi:hypothetical protein
MALDDIGNDHTYEGDQKKPSDELEDPLIGAPPDIDDKAFEKLGDRKLQHPETR